MRALVLASVSASLALTERGLGSNEENIGRSVVKRKQERHNRERPFARTNTAIWSRFA